MPYVSADHYRKPLLFMSRYRLFLSDACKIHTGTTGIHVRYLWENRLCEKSRKIPAFKYQDATVANRQLFVQLKIS